MKTKLLGVSLAIAVCITGCNKEEIPKSVDKEVVNLVQQICNASYDFTSDDEIERYLANCIETVNIGDTIIFTIKPYERINDIDVDVSDLKEAYLSDSVTDLEVEDYLNKIYSNARKENCFKSSETTKEVVITDKSMILSTLLEESNIINNIRVYEKLIKNEVRSELNE
jgi:hypothetical protein